MTIHNPADQVELPQSALLDQVTNQPEWVLLDHLPDPIAVLDSSRMICFINAAWRVMAAKLGHLSLFEPGRAYLEADRLGFDRYDSDSQVLADGLQNVLAGNTERIDLTFTGQHHASAHWQMTIVPYQFGAIFGALIVQRNMAEDYRNTTALIHADSNYKSIFENAVEGIFRTSADGRYLQANPALAQIYGYDSPIDLLVNLTNIKKQLYVDSARRDSFVNLLNHNGSVIDFESQIYRKDGSIIWIVENARAIRDSHGALLYYEGFVTDITLRKQIEERMRHHTLHDMLTNLPNRELMIDRLSQNIERMRRNSHYYYATLLLDLDHFKVINDSLGHLVGDQVLIEVARRLEHCVRSTDTIARLGGDEFVIILEDIPDAHDTLRLAERILDSLSKSFEIDGHEIYMTASIGIVLSGAAYERPEQIMRDADTALYRAKALGRGRSAVFDVEMHTRAMERLQLELDLRRAIERGELRLYYQPIVSLATGEISGFEALIRWIHPVRNMISPADFIPIAEETGLIVPIGQWVLYEACRQLQEWQQKFSERHPLTMSVNLSGRQLFAPGLRDYVAATLKETGIDGAYLKLEITESVMMQNAEVGIEVLRMLRHLSTEVQIDDFGTGYSSLSYLHRFPIQTLKIDRSFISRIDTDRESAEIVRAIVVLAQNLGLAIVAEGIETAAHLELVQALQCTYGQGYWFARPMDAASVEELLANWVS